jgi:hypothetical protein
MLRICNASGNCNARSRSRQNNMACFLLQQLMGLGHRPGAVASQTNAAGPIRPCAPEPRILPRVCPAGRALFDGSSVVPHGWRT